jgi:hypothetical protein
MRSLSIFIFAYFLWFMLVTFLGAYLKARVGGGGYTEDGERSRSSSLLFFDEQRKKKRKHDIQKQTNRLYIKHFLSLGLIAELRSLFF